MNNSVVGNLKNVITSYRRCLFLFCSLAVMSSCAEKDVIQIFLCIGQSNMAGRADIQSQDNNSLKNAYLVNGKRPKIR
jgi:hypothetical protein